MPFFLRFKSTVLCLSICFFTCSQKQKSNSHNDPIEKEIVVAANRTQKYLPQPTFLDLAPKSRWGMCSQSPKAHNQETLVGIKELHLDSATLLKYGAAPDVLVTYPGGPAMKYICKLYNSTSTGNSSGSHASSTQTSTTHKKKDI